MLKLLPLQNIFAALITLTVALFNKCISKLYFLIIVYGKDFGYLDHIYSLIEHAQKRRDMRVIARHLNIPINLDEKTLRDRIHDVIYPLEKEDHSNTSHFKHICHDYVTDEDGPIWVVFLPWRITLDEAKQHKLLPTTGRVIAYEGPIGLVNPDPSHVKDYILKLVKDLRSKKIGKFNLVGLSVGNYVAFYAASKFKHIEKFISVVPGYDLGACMYDSCSASLVADMAKELGYRSHHAYDKELKQFNPGKHFNNLPKNIEIHIAEHDKSIEVTHALKLIKRLKKLELNINEIIYKGKGHVLTIAHVGQINIYK